MSHADAEVEVDLGDDQREEESPTNGSKTKSQHRE